MLSGVSDTQPGVAAVLKDEYAYFLEFAATVIQRHFRGYLVRRDFYRQLNAIKRQQAAAEENEARLYLVNTAARIIQRAWQSFRNKRIYRFYRDLIQFRAVTDINAFGPRNYAGEVPLSAKQLHNKPGRGASTQLRNARDDFRVDDSLREFIRPDGTRGMRSTQGWYARVENNGWRPISERVLVDEDPVTTATKAHRQPLFHFDPAVRRDERVRRAKQRRRDWLLKMYTGAGGEPNEQSDAGLPRLPGSSLADLDPDDMDELQHLDFNSYTTDWTSLACTLGSEALTPWDTPPAASLLPPQGQDVRAALAAAGAPLQPFQGGPSPAMAATSSFHPA
ncbi:hypothetical protein QJQ45_000833 [Haematococcus lacustris]|nr:hypothetical protein QJQ45_000833 [Haematococcus lacustris]